MKTTESYKCNDPVRGELVSATPEELVRQSLLRTMIQSLGYPRAYLSVEKRVLRARRRADVICYTNVFDAERLLPLLIVECKAGTGSLHEARQQLLGYNRVVKAPFLCVVNECAVTTFWVEEGQEKSVAFLPSYQELCRLLK